MLSDDITILAVRFASQEADRRAVGPRLSGYQTTGTGTWERLMRTFNLVFLLVSLHINVYMFFLG